MATSDTTQARLELAQNEIARLKADLATLRALEPEERRAVDIAAEREQMAGEVNWLFAGASIGIARACAAIAHKYVESYDPSDSRWTAMDKWTNGATYAQEPGQRRAPPQDPERARLATATNELIRTVPIGISRLCVASMRGLIQGYDPSNSTWRALDSWTAEAAG